MKKIIQYISVHHPMSRLYYDILWLSPHHPQKSPWFWGWFCWPENSHPPRSPSSGADDHHPGTPGHSAAWGAAGVGKKNSGNTPNPWKKWKTSGKMMRSNWNMMRKWMRKWWSFFWRRSALEMVRTTSRNRSSRPYAQRRKGISIHFLISYLRHQKPTSEPWKGQVASALQPRHHLPGVSGAGMSPRLRPIFGQNYREKFVT